jgi:hypothetical protein
VRHGCRIFRDRTVAFSGQDCRIFGLLARLAKMRHPCRILQGTEVVPVAPSAPALDHQQSGLAEHRQHALDGAPGEPGGCRDRRDGGPCFKLASLFEDAAIEAAFAITADVFGHFERIAGQRSAVRQLGVFYRIKPSWSLVLECAFALGIGALAAVRFSVTIVWTGGSTSTMHCHVQRLLALDLKAAFAGWSSWSPPPLVFCKTASTQLAVLSFYTIAGGFPNHSAKTRDAAEPLRAEPAHHGSEFMTPR